MRKIKEKQLLVNLAVSLGQDVDPELVKEVTKFNTIKKGAHESIKKSASKDFAEALKEVKIEMQPIQLSIRKDPVFYPLPPTLDEVLTILKEKEVVNELVQPQAIEEPTFREEIPDTTLTEASPEESLAERTAKFISEAPKDSFQQPDPLVVPDNMDAIRGKLKFLEQWIGKISMHGPGGGAGDTTTISSYTKLVTDNSYTIGRKDFYVGVNYPGPSTITLPSINVDNGRQLAIKDESGLASINPITVLGNVDNDPNGFIIKLNNGGIQLIYRNGWRII